MTQWYEEPERWALIKTYRDKSVNSRRERMSPTLIAICTNKFVLREIAFDITRRSVWYENKSWDAWQRCFWNKLGTVDVWTRYEIVEYDEQLFQNSN